MLIFTVCVPGLFSQAFAAVGNYFVIPFSSLQYVEMIPVGFSFNAIDLALVQGAEGAPDKATGLQFPM